MKYAIIGSGKIARSIQIAVLFEPDGKCLGDDVAMG
jgi:hypothetical protein